MKDKTRHPKQLKKHTSPLSSLPSPRINIKPNSSTRHIPPPTLMRIPTPFTIIDKLLKLALTIIRINCVLPITTIIDVKNHLIRRIPPRKFDLTPRRDGLTRPLIARVAATRPGWSSAADCPAAIALLVWGWVVLAAVSTGAVVVDAFEYLGLGCGGTCQWGCCWEGWVLLN